MLKMVSGVLLLLVDTALRGFSTGPVCSQKRKPQQNLSLVVCHQPSMPDARIKEVSSMGCFAADGCGRFR